MGFNINSDTLLSIEDICTRLSISRSTLDRWRGIGERSLSKSYLEMTKDNDNVQDFPQPTLYFGKSPRWSSKDVNQWLNDQKL